MPYFTMDSHFSWQYWVLKLTAPFCAPACHILVLFCPVVRAFAAFCLSFVYFSYMTKSTDVVVVGNFLATFFFIYFPFLPFQQILSMQHVPHVLLLHVAYLKSPEIYVRNLLVSPPGTCATGCGSAHTCGLPRQLAVDQAAARPGLRWSWRRRWRQSRTWRMRKAERGVLSLWQRGYCLASEVFCGLSTKPVASMRQPRGGQAPHLFPVPVAATVPAPAPCHVALECGQSDCDFCCLMHMPYT